MKRGPSYLFSKEDRECGLIIPRRHVDLVPLVIEGTKKERGNWKTSSGNAG